MGMCGAVPRPRRPRRGARAQLQRLALAAARREREAADLRLQDDARRLGALTVARAGPIGAPPRHPLYPWFRSHSYLPFWVPIEPLRLVPRAPMLQDAEIISAPCA